MIKIREMRKMRGMTVKELASAVGIKEVSVYRYERGMRIPTVDIALKFADALGCSINDLLEH